MKAIIVDDESESRELLSNIIKNHIPEVKVVGSASNAEEAVSLILDQSPEVVFLDIDMPQKSGLEVAREIRLNKLDTTIIFITAYNQYAIEAFKFAAFDYLLKPVDTDQLKICIYRLMNTSKVKDLQFSIDNLLTYLNQKKISFRSNVGTLFINPYAIVFCRAEGNYTEVFLSNGSSQMISQRIGDVEKQLSRDLFTRISRSVVINYQYLDQIQRKNKKCVMRAGNTEWELDIKNQHLKRLIS